MLCPACGGRLTAWRSVPGSEPALADARFELLRCDSCGTAVTVGDAPPELHQSGAYRPGAPRLSGLAAPVLRTFDRQRLAVLGAPAGARILDAGAGRGRFVATATAAGYDAAGIEPSPRGPEDARIARVTIEDARFTSASFDAVTLWHVLEHLDDPAAALERIAGWLVPGGLLLVGVPNIGSWQARAGGERWYHLDVPRHRTHFTPAGLEALLRTSGFEPVTTRYLLLEHNPFGMWQSLVNRASRNPSYLYNLLKRNAPVRSPDLLVAIAALTLVPVAAALELLAGLARRGGTMAALARRVE